MNSKFQNIFNPDLSSEGTKIEITNTKNISKSCQPLIGGDKVAGVELAARLVCEAFKPPTRGRVGHLNYL